MERGGKGGANFLDVFGSQTTDHIVKETIVEEAEIAVEEKRLAVGSTLKILQSCCQGETLITQRSVSLEQPVMDVAISLQLE